MTDRCDDTAGSCARRRSIRPRRSRAALDRTCELAKTDGAAAATAVADGPAADAVVEAMKKSRNDLVVMGSHGHRGVKRALLGSAAERVILNAPCPVLVVGAA